MYVTICGRRLPVHVEYDLHDDFGTPAEAVFRPRRPDIALDASLRADWRVDRLFHELEHAYDHFIGRCAPDDEEGRANRTATIVSAFKLDLAAQGGEQIIHAMYGDAAPPPPTLALGDPIYVAAGDDAGDWPSGVCCPACRETHPGHAVRAGEPHWDPKIGGYVMRRTLACDRCERESRWTQRCSPEGQPWPAVVTAPEIRRIELVA